jgi:hypothetical protein
MLSPELMLTSENLLLQVLLVEPHRGLKRIRSNFVFEKKFKKNCPYFETP